VLTPKCEKNVQCVSRSLFIKVSGGWLTGTSETRTLECTGSVGVKIVRKMSPEVLS